MEWIDSGIVLGVRRHGEANAIAELMTRAHGRHLGLVRGGAGSRLRPVLQPGNAVGAILDRMHDRALAGAHVARFELQLIAELGFGLDLDRCAVTGEAADLVYVSPKSGRAVSRTAGVPWQDKLLRLPRFLVEEEPRTVPSPEELADGLALTGFFRCRYVFEPRGQVQPEARAHFLAAILQARRAAG